MLQLEGKLPALVIDPDKEFLKQLQLDPSSALAPPVVATTGKEAQLILADRSRRYIGIFVNPKIADPGGLSVIRMAHMHHIGTPLFLLCDDASPYSDQELRRLAVQSALQKPLSYSEILAIVAPIIPTFDATAALAQSATNKDPLDKEVDLQDLMFTPIRIENFLAGHRSFFDVYVRIKAGRYLKVLQGGDTFSEERVTSYISKGVVSFFIRKDTHANYVSYCDHLATALISHPKAPMELKLSQAMNAGEETLSFLSAHDVSKNSIQHAVRFTKNVERFVNQLRLGDHPALKSYLQDVATYDHAVGATLVAGLLLPPLKFNLERLQLAIGVATLLHDVGLFKTAPHLEDKEESQMTLEELHLYHEHPRESARILATVRGVDSIALHAVIQHHERRDGKGFPNKARPGAISLISEVLGISDEYVRLLRLARKDPKVNPMHRMHTDVFNGFSTPVIQAFLEVMTKGG